MKLIMAVCVSLFLLGCSKMTEDELWQRVERSRASNNHDSTIQVCQTILKEYPDGRKAAPALYSLAETYQNGKHDYHAAVDYYRDFTKKYPDLNSTPIAMFLVGFIYNNNLQMIDSAGIAYTDFLSKFPNHELALSARFELQNLGKSPNEIIAPDKNVAAKPEKSKSKKKK